MKGPPLGALAGGAIVIVALVLAIAGAPTARHAAPPPAPVAAPPPSVSAGGVTLSSAAIELPGDGTEALPPGPHVDLVTSTCTACHSASMITRQPSLSADQWKATVAKMREAYHAPVSEADVPAILAYLNGLSGAPAGSLRQQ